MSQSLTRRSSFFLPERSYSFPKQQLFRDRKSGNQATLESRRGLKENANGRTRARSGRNEARKEGRKEAGWWCAWIAPACLSCSQAGWMDGRKEGRKEGRNRALFLFLRWERERKDTRYYTILDPCVCLCERGILSFFLSFFPTEAKIEREREQRSHTLCTHGTGKQELFQRKDDLPSSSSSCRNSLFKAFFFFFQTDSVSCQG